MANPNERTAQDMANARKATVIDIPQVRSFLHHGQAAWNVRERIVKILTDDPAFDNSEREFLTRTERYTRGLALTDRIYQLQEVHNWSQHETKVAFASLSEQLPIGLHNVAFEPVFMSQASPELLTKYARLVSTCGVLGCYLQTELAHGTNVSSLETTATFIPETQEFDIHSPTLTSTKWWIGALGKMATHGVVQAKLILHGKDLGPHLFFVQLRSLDDHMPLPGIIIGDIGPKAMSGYAATDNGFARFTHYRIPRDHMLSKFAQVTREGEYVQPPHAKLSYGGMLYIRSNMVTGAGWLTAKAATVAIRYATVRRQGEKGLDGVERQIITYPSVYYRLLPVLSRAYVLIQLGKSLTDAFNTMSSRLASGDASLLAEMHATTSGLKILCSSSATQDIETSRRSMGGHGYSAFAGLGRVYADYLPSMTYEGDNFVLDGQVVRAALKSYHAAFSSTHPSTSSLSPSSAYLRLLINASYSTPKPSQVNWTDAATAILLLEWRAAKLVQAHAQNLAQPDASVVQRVSKAITEAFVAVQVGGIIRGLEMEERTKDVVAKLYLLYLLTTTEAALTDLLSFDLLPTGSEEPRGDPSGFLRLAINSLCTYLLPHAIGLTDAFSYTDWELDSALGVYNGRVYEALWERVQQEPLNRTQVPEAYEKSIRPILLRGQKQAAALDKAKL